MSEFIFLFGLVALLAAVGVGYAVWHGKAVAARLDAANAAVTGAVDAVTSDAKAVASAADATVSVVKSAAATVAAAAQGGANRARK
jgi:flagellar basal body-associated protein FliL